MKPMIILPIFLVAAISIQCVLALKQGRNLGNTFSEMKGKGDVLVGKYKTYFRGGAYIFFNINCCGIVEDAKVISGRTIFSSMQSLSECIGKDVRSLRFEKHCVQKAYEDAAARYAEAVDFAKKEEKDMGGI